MRTEGRRSRLNVEVAVRAIVQFTASEADLGTRLDELERAGVQLDRQYGGKGAICVNPRLGRYVARGELSDHALSVLRKFGHYEIFADVKVVPTSHR
jgi:hypothetical protein